jgi:TonB family protein
MIAYRLTSVLALGLLAIPFSLNALAETAAQQDPNAHETARGVGLQREGKAEEAIASLRAAVKRDKKDITAWHYLGLALERKGEMKEARKAHEKAANRGDELLTNLLTDSKDGEEISRRLRRIGPSLIEAAESAQKCLQLTPKPSGRKLTERQLQTDSLLAFAEMANAPAGTPVVLTGKEVSVKARVLSKPEPQYTDEARAKQITGTVVLRAIFAANGRVVGIHAVSGLPHGLTEQAIYAARQIKFVPAIKDGRPVSVLIQLEYNFNLF